jgi:hypothetical protein
MDVWFVMQWHMADIQNGKFQDWLNSLEKSGKYDYLFLDKLVPIGEKSLVACVICHPVKEKEVEHDTTQN